MQMTYGQYDRIEEKFEKLPKNVYWPTPDQIEMFQSNPDKWLLFCLYLSEYNPEPETKDEEMSCYDMKQFLYKNLELVDDEENST